MVKEKSVTEDKSTYSPTMEFLQVYGWAILVVVVAIGSLWYFGVLNPQHFSPPVQEWQDKEVCLFYNIGNNLMTYDTFASSLETQTLMYRMDNKNTTIKYSYEMYRLGHSDTEINFSRKDPNTKNVTRYIFPCAVKINAQTSIKWYNESLPYTEFIRK